jgi:tetratricopeptide (TPR) repeat protein
MNRSPAWLAIVILALGAATACHATPKATLPPPAGGPHFPDYVFPSVPATLAPPAIDALHELGWQWLQAGDPKAAERNFTAALRQSPGFYPSEAGLGYAALARKDTREAASRFDRALAVNPAYAPALAGRGEALLTLGQRDQALAAFQAAVAADPQLSSLKSRIEVLRFRGLQDDVDVARKAAEAGRLEDARVIYERTIVASPDSPFLYRELAIVERREGNLARALEHAQKAATMNPTEPRNFITIGEIYEAQAEYGKAAEAYTTAVSLEPSEAIEARLDDLKAKAAFATMPEEYRSIESSPSVTRAQLAALIGVRLDDVLKRAPRSNSVVITDTRGSWAAPWILSVARAGLMEVYPNHTFLPNSAVRRADLAQMASSALNVLASNNPRLAATLRTARGRFPDVPPGHLNYQAASAAVESGVMSTTADGTFQLSRPITGQEAVTAIGKLSELSGRQAR